MNDEPIRLRVRRVGAPRWAKWDGHPGPGMADMYAVTGEQPDWGWGIPLVHRAIASPSEGLPVPRKPAEGCNFSNALGYWAALLHVCLYTLGWVRPETGLFRLLESVDPEFGDVEDLDAGLDDAEADPRVQLLRSVWLHDGDLALFVAWLSRFDLYQYRDLLGEVTGQRFDQWTFEVDRQWVEHQADRAAQVQYPTPAPGGDPLHLSGHCSGPLADPSSHGGRQTNDHFAFTKMARQR